MQFNHVLEELQITQTRFYPKGPVWSSTLLSVRTFCVWLLSFCTYFTCPQYTAVVHETKHEPECLEFTGQISGEAVDALATTLKRYKSMKMLTIEASAGIDTLIDNTSLELLDLTVDVGYDEKEIKKIAKAVCRSKTLHSVGFGHWDNSCDLFVKELLESYPSEGPLRALYVHYEATEALTSLVEALREKLNTKSLQTFYGVHKDHMMISNGFKFQWFHHY